VNFRHSDATIVDTSGAFSIAITGTTATIDSNPFIFATPDELIFNTVSGPVTLTLTGPIEVQLDSSEFLDFSGTGILTLPGYAATLATFSSDSTDGASPSNYGLSGSSSFGIDVSSSGIPLTVTPEPGTFSLLALGLLGMAMVLRGRLFVRPTSLTATASC
jgi:hypothetical protein